MMPKRNKSPLDKALNYLSFRPRTEKEIRDYLGLDCTEEIIAKLKKLNFINDVDFAQWYTESRSRSRPRSKKLLQLELKRKGIVSDLSNLSDVELATVALSKKKNLKSRDQAIRFLASRGFSWGTIEQAIKNKYNDPNVG